jgi:hypothetical protein
MTSVDVKLFTIPIQKTGIIPEERYGIEEFLNFGKSSVKKRHAKKRGMSL